MGYSRPVTASAIHMTLFWIGKKADNQPSGNRNGDTHSFGPFILNGNSPNSPKANRLSPASFVDIRNVGSSWSEVTPGFRLISVNAVDKLAFEGHLIASSVMSLGSFGAIHKAPMRAQSFSYPSQF